MQCKRCRWRIFFSLRISLRDQCTKLIGAVIQQVAIQRLPVRLFTPLQIKLAVTGYGTAEKNQVQEMVRLLLKLEKIPASDHAADSLAAAICLAANSATELRMQK